MSSREWNPYQPPSASTELPSSRKVEETAFFTPLDFLTKVLRGCFWVDAGLKGVEIVAYVAQFELLNRMRAHQPFSHAEAQENDQRLRLLALIELPVLLASLILFCVFLYRANSNLRALGVEGVHFTPRAAVGWSFVPIAHLFVPYRVVQELWQASGTVAGPSWKTIKPPAYFQGWWAAWLVGTTVAHFARMPKDAKDVDIPLLHTVLAMVSAASILVAAILVAKIVGEIRRRQEARAEALDKLR